MSMSMSWTARDATILLSDSQSHLGNIDGQAVAHGRALQRLLRSTKKRTHDAGDANSLHVRKAVTHYQS